MKKIEINILKNAQGETVEGNNSQIDNIEDTWVFSKELNGRQNWALIQVNAS
jgi:predicted lipid-binding transport protein (Tim44 family)